MSRRPRKTPSGGAQNPALRPSTDRLGVGDSPAAPSAASPPRRQARERAAFGSYLDPQIQREFKARCVLLGIEMQDGLEQAITQWLKDQKGA